MTSKDIKFTNYELFAMVVTALLSQILTIHPTNFIKNAGSASVTVFILVTFVIYLIYKFILNTMLKKEYDFFTLLRNTYSKTTIKFIGSFLYLYFFLGAVIFTLNISLQLKVMTYTLSPVYTIAIYILIGAFLGSVKGLSPLFKIVGYIFPFLFIYLMFIFLMSLPFFEYHNFLPLLGNGFKESILYNLPNLSMFAPLISFIIFTRNNKTRKDRRKNKKLFKYIIITFCICMICAIITFLNTMPLRLIATRVILLFDINRMLSQLPSAQKLEPLLIFVYSMISFVCIGFTILCACLSFEKTNIVASYSSYILPSFVILGLFTFIPINMEFIYMMSNIFSYVSLFTFILLPLFSILKYKYKERKNEF